jgi:predicted TPR repeat methyltransferase
VFIYLGALNAVISWAAANLTPAGILAFSVEALADGDIALQENGRYAHSAAYLTHLLTAAGLNATLTPATLRLDRGAPVASLIVTAVRR